MGGMALLEACQRFVFIFAIVFQMKGLNGQKYSFCSKDDLCDNNLKCDTETKGPRGVGTCLLAAGASCLGTKAGLCASPYECENGICKILAPSLKTTSMRGSQSPGDFEVEVQDLGLGFGLRETKPCTGKPPGECRTGQQCVKSSNSSRGGKCHCQNVNTPNTVLRTVSMMGNCDEKPDKCGRNLVREKTDDEGMVCKGDEGAKCKDDDVCSQFLKYVVKLHLGGICSILKTLTGTGDVIATSSLLPSLVTAMVASYLTLTFK